MAVRFLAFWVLFLVLGSSALAQSNQRIPVVVGLVARPLAESEVGGRVVARDAAFMIQRVEAIGSVTLRNDIIAPGRGRGAQLAAGAQLLLARGPGPNRLDYYCGAYNPRGGFVTWINSGFSVEWVCFNDSDADGSFDVAYQTPANAGGVHLLPTFEALISPSAINAPYQIDSSANVFAYERAIMHRPSGRAYVFKLKVRVAGEGEWIDLLSSGRGTQGGTTSILEADIPKEVSLSYARFQVTSASESGLEINNQEVQTGVFRLSVGY